VTITADFQADLGGVTVGAGTLYAFEAAVPVGLGLAEVRAQDAWRGDRDGDVATDDVYDARTITLDLAVTAMTAAGAGAAIAALKAAWAARTVETTLDVRIPGTPETVLRYYGRPRGLAVDLELLLFGLARAQATFRALDPFAYGAAVTGSALTPGTATVTNAGDAPTDRVTIALVGNGGTPTVTNTTDSSGSIAWTAPLANAATRTIDLRARTVVDGSSADKYPEVAPGSRWFRLLPGANTIVVAGCTSATFTYRPAWP